MKGKTHMRKGFLSTASALAIMAGAGWAAVAQQVGTASEAFAAGPCGTVATAPTYTHVVWILMENHSLGDIIRNTQAPYINQVAGECGLATNYHNLSHPSLPNYVGMTSGLAGRSLKPFDPDCNPSKKCSTTAQSIFGQGETWKAYEESMPSDCAPANSGEYAVRHDPPPYYPALAAQCATQDVPYTQLASDLASNTLPAFSFITPNLIDDMHDGTILQGDTWLSTNLPTILNSPEYTSGTTAVFITWDEGTGGKNGEACSTNTTDPSCLVATLVVSPSTPAGATSAVLFNHYSLLGTAEQLLGLPALGQAASSATMTSAFDL
jgi:phospholipase C